MGNAAIHTRQVALGRILIVEDEKFTRMLVSTSLSALGFDVVGSCSDASTALQIQRNLHVEIALLDLDLGIGPSGIDIAYALRRNNPNIGIVFLSSFSDPRIRNSHERSLPTGSRFIVKGKLGDADQLRNIVLHTRHHPLKVLPADISDLGLTDRQIDVLRLVAGGFANADIASTLNVTEKAVERLVQRISEALELSSVGGNRRVHLARAYAELAGKVPPSP
jgi:DNA-binding NarL/FixJ family response regulator